MYHGTRAQVCLNIYLRTPKEQHMHHTFYITRLTPNLSKSDCASLLLHQNIPPILYNLIFTWYCQTLKFSVTFRRIVKFHNDLNLHFPDRTFCIFSNNFNFFCYNMPVLGLLLWVVVFLILTVYIFNHPLRLRR